MMRMMLLALIFMATTVYADVETYMENAQYAHMDGDHDKRYYWLNKAALEDHAPAITHIGHMYYYGEGFAKDYDMARKMYEVAVAQNFPDALYHLGQMYYHASGVKQSYSKAFKYFRSAATQGHGSAQYMVADMYHNETGDLLIFLEAPAGSDHNNQMAIKWAKMAADNGKDKAWQLIEKIKRVCELCS